MNNNCIKDQIKDNIQKLFDIFNIPKTDSNADTPGRVSKMLINELFIGLNKRKFPKYKMFKFQSNKNEPEPIIIENIDIYSICEHHLLPFTGKATFKYVPKDKVIGLSKIPRIIDFLARKPQLQEKLTDEIFETFCKILDTNSVSIKLKCEHMCVKMRGIKDGCILTTSKNGGIFQQIYSNKHDE